VEKAQALLISRHPLTETSLIVHWCSRDYGLFKTVAKGALRPKSSFAGRLDLFVSCEVAFVRSRSSDLHILREAHLSEARLGLRESYARVLAATYFGKLVELVAESETPLDGVYELLLLAVDYLAAHEPSPALVERFERRLCELLGLGTGVSNAAVLLSDVFHRPLPPQRETLMLTLKRNQGCGAPESGSDFA